MIDISKLNDTILDLENEVENIKSISKIVGELDRLNNEVNINRKSSEDALSKLSEARDDLLKAIGVYEDSLINIKETIIENDKSIDGRIHEMKDENYSFNRELIKSYKDMENQLLTQVQEIRNESKKLYLEFEDILSSKLDRNKSDIQVEVRNKVGEVMKFVDSIMISKFKSLDDKMDNDSILINKKIEKQNILIFVLMALVIINIIIKFI